MEMWKKEKEETREKREEREYITYINPVAPRLVKYRGYALDHGCGGVLSCQQVLKYLLNLYLIWLCQATMDQLAVTRSGRRSNCADRIGVDDPKHHVLPCNSSFSFRIGGVWPWTDIVVSGFGSHV
jgi:hypothetical protein